MKQFARRIAPLSLRLVLCASLCAWASPALAAAKKKTKKQAVPEVQTPQALPVAPAPPPPPPVATPRPEGEGNLVPGTVPPVVPPPDKVPAPRGTDDEQIPSERPAPRSRWEGFFVSFNLGYATAGGREGQVIPALQKGDAAPPPGTPNASLLKSAFPDSYKRLVTTNKGTGIAAALQIGYNILGYVSLWADLSWHGTFGSKIDMAGAGTAAAMVGFHPLRFVRQGQLPVDLKLYGGYGFFDINYYYETEVQPEATGKAWTGTALPFGLQTEYRLSEHFALGVDLRTVKASYDKWIYSDKDAITSRPSPPETTLRYEPRLTFAGHF